MPLLFVCYIWFLEFPKLNSFLSGMLLATAKGYSMFPRSAGVAGRDRKHLHEDAALSQGHCARGRHKKAAEVLSANFLVQHCRIQLLPSRTSLGQTWAQRGPDFHRTVFWRCWAVAIFIPSSGPMLGNDKFFGPVNACQN